MPKRLMYLTGATLLLFFGLIQQAQAAIITFDQPIAQGANATLEQEPGFIDQYRPPDQFPGAPNPDAFITQGATFGGYTPPVTAMRTSPELIIMLDASKCLAYLGTTCASDGSKFLIALDAFSMFAPGAPFSLNSFDATGFFPPAGCPLYIEGVQVGCDEQQIIYPAEYIKVFAIGAGNVILGTQTFALTSSFGSFTLTDPGFSSVLKVIFMASDAQGVRAERIMALDNINVTSSVPEPASLLLLGTGLAGAMARRRRRG